MLIKYFKNRRIKKEHSHFRKRIESLLKRDDDIFSDSEKNSLIEIAGKAALLKTFDNSRAEKEYNNLSNKLIKLFPEKRFKFIREYAEILVVALTVAFGVRALYTQPFKIPTSSMQPTLFGIHYVNKPVIPNIPQPLNYLLFSTLRADLTVQQNGAFQGIYPPFDKFFIFPWTALQIGGMKYELPGAPQKVTEYCFGKFQQMPETFKPGDVLCDGWLSDGDHLFVNRLAYHFSEPARGDIIVFTTNDLYNDSTGEPLSRIGYYYVKRLVGMPGDTLKIENSMLMVKPKGSDKFVPITSFGVEAFKRVYSGKGGYQPYLPVGRLALGSEVKIPEKSYFMMGDNTLWSADSRYWGFVPRANIVGKASFVFWPLSRRFGITDSRNELDVPTSVGPNGYIKAMTLQ
ncbi:MAG TPA: signal peptidase I [Lentisphaeria bacterium]|nr:MAG: signal peptidase I [Lentisphaerae bacterium GWF2_38_69]HBM16838.1 signal peptidase I [Lentisphaeria bacterium]